jgi:hypothetical protein
MKFYIVVCRIAFDDEDTAFVLHLPSSREAVKEAERMLRQDDAENENEFVLSYVFECATPPVELHNPND